MLSGSERGSYILPLFLTRCQTLPVLTNNVRAGVGGVESCLSTRKRGPGRKGTLWQCNNHQS